MAEDVQPTADPEMPPDPPIIPPTEPAPEPPRDPNAPNYHIFLWPDPPGPQPYLCLLCPARDPSEAVIQAHVLTEHGIDPLPTPMAAHPPTVDPAMGLQMAPRQEGSPHG
jgi:hypothetical protein